MKDKNLKNKTKSSNFLKTLKDKKLILPIVLSLSGIVVGGVAGYFVANVVYAKKYGDIYSNLGDSISLLEDDMDALMSRYEKVSKSSYSTSFKSYELVNIGFEKLKKHNTVMQQTFGVVDAMGVKQTIRGCTLKVNDEFFMENLSVSSIVQAGKRFYQSGENITTYNGSNISTEVASWSDNRKEVRTLSEHEEKWGKTLSRPLIYIVSSKTSLPTCETKKTSGGYEVTINLDPTYGVLRYVKQMCSISDIQPPKFKSVSIKYYLDNELNLIKNEVKENYVVVMGVKVDSKATMTEYFNYDGDYKIPDINTNFTYVKGE